MSISPEITESYYPGSAGTESQPFKGDRVNLFGTLTSPPKSTGQDEPARYPFTMDPKARNWKHHSGAWQNLYKIKVSFSERELERMARSRPAQLAGLIRNDLLDDVDLAFAARAAAEVQSMILVGILIELLDHSSGFVREGAIYGLAPHLAANERIQKALTEISKTDPNLGVREAAQEALDG